MALMGHIAAAVGWMFAGLAAAGSFYTAMTAVLVLRFFDARRGPTAEVKEAPATRETVTLLKPLHGAEAGLRQNLAAHFFQERYEPLQVVFGVQRLDDPAADIARALMADHPDVASDLAIDAQERGVKLRIRVDADAIHADHDLLRRTLANLIENSIRYAPPTSSVSISATRTDGRQRRQQPGAPSARR